jgi:hypothetical protein
MNNRNRCCARKKTSDVYCCYDAQIGGVKDKLSLWQQEPRHAKQEQQGRYPAFQTKAAEMEKVAAEMKEAQLSE